MSQQAIVKGDALQKIAIAALIIVAVLIVLSGLLMLPADDLNLYASHPNPAAGYAEAVQRVESLRAAEILEEPAHIAAQTAFAEIGPQLDPFAGTQGNVIPLDGLLQQAAVSSDDDQGKAIFSGQLIDARIGTVEQAQAVDARFYRKGEIRFTVDQDAIA